MHFCLRPSVAKSFPTFREFTFFEHVNYIVKYATNTSLFNQQLYAKSNSSYYKTWVGKEFQIRQPSVIDSFLNPKDTRLHAFPFFSDMDISQSNAWTIGSVPSELWLNFKNHWQNCYCSGFLADVDEQIHGPMENHSALWKSYTFNNATKTLKIELESVNFTMLCKLTKK